MNAILLALIFKLVRRMDKEELLRKSCVQRERTTQHMNLGIDYPGIINEVLSLARRRPFVAVRQIKREKLFKYQWTRGRKSVFRRKRSAPIGQGTLNDYHNLAELVFYINIYKCNNISLYIYMRNLYSSVHFLSRLLYYFLIKQSVYCILEITRFKLCSIIRIMGRKYKTLIKYL